MGGFTVLPTNDLASKKVLANPEHKEIIQGFIHDFLNLDISVDEIKIMNPYSVKAYRAMLTAKQAAEARVETPANEFANEPAGESLSDLGSPRFGVQLRKIVHDINIVIDTADVTIEMQIANHDAFMKRVHLYLADVYASNYHQQTLPGNNYVSLKPVWSINYSWV